MATADLTREQRIQRSQELRSRVLIGRLPDDFLRLPSTSHPGQLAPGLLAAMDPATQFYSFVPPNTRGRLVLKVVEARLAKNYGLMMRMDPYCRVRIGNAVFQTHTSMNGGKNPVWNRLIVGSLISNVTTAFQNAYLPNGVESVYVQIFDEVCLNVS
jgi:toll-interacting protein